MPPPRSSNPGSAKPAKTTIRSTDILNCTISYIVIEIEQDNVELAKPPQSRDSDSQPRCRHGRRAARAALAGRGQGGAAGDPIARRGRRRGTGRRVGRVSPRRSAGHAKTRAAASKSAICRQLRRADSDFADGSQRPRRRRAGRSSSSNRPASNRSCPTLSREHAQTVAVVLSYLAPARAAQVLAALPEQVAGRRDRATLDARRHRSRQLAGARTRAGRLGRATAGHAHRAPTQRTDTVAAILAAADQASRGEILANLVKHNQQLARADCAGAAASQEIRASATPTRASCRCRQPAVRPRPPSLPRLALRIDDLARLDKSALAAVLRTVDAEVLVLALVGASEALVERITDQMPRQDRQGIPPAAASPRSDAAPRRRSRATGSRRRRRSNPSRPAIRTAHARSMRIVDTMATIIRKARSPTAAAPAGRCSRSRSTSRT